MVLIMTSTKLHKKDLIAFNSIWDSVTGILSQDQIDRIEEIHKKDFEWLEI